MTAFCAFVRQAFRAHKDTALGLRLARFVRRGEKGIFILAPTLGNKRKKDEADKTEQDTDANETQRTLYGFRGVYVFDRLSRDLRPSVCALDVARGCHFRKSPR
jgi:hypothetical protein